MHMRTTKLVRHALHCTTKKLQNNQLCKQIKLNMTIKKACYSLCEPKLDVKEAYVRKMKKQIASNSAVGGELLCAFRSTFKPLAENIEPSKLKKAVLNIATRKMLHWVLKARKESVGELLGCIRSVNAMKVSVDDFGESRHIASSEPYFYDQCYSIVKHASPIVMEKSGRCVIAEEVGERDAKTQRPQSWKCTHECKLPTSEEVKYIMATKELFEKPVQKLRKELNGIDECSVHGHYTCQLNSEHEKPYRELAGHPLTCTNLGCGSNLRVIRAAAGHFPVVRMLTVLLYTAIRQHRLIDSIHTALCAGDFEKLAELCHVSDYKDLFKACSSSDDDIAAGLDHDSSQPIKLQEQKLPDIESDLHVEYAELIANLEKHFDDDAEFPCCSCERLFQRKKVTEFKFSAEKFSSDVWKLLKQHMSQKNSNTGSESHYVCQYCRPILCENRLPCRCILNVLMTEPMPKELQALDPLSKQLIHRGKAFQTILRLRTYTGKVPSHNSLKACKGTMFFLPLPLDKTLKTIDNVENDTTIELPNPELYIIVSGKPSKNKILWQSLVNIAQIKAAVQKLKTINWLYADIDDSSVDDASRRIIECVSDTTSSMLVKASSEDISSFQAYMIRRLDQKQSNLTDTEQYKLMNVKEDALSNKLKHLDVLCFPTLFPSGKFGESHDRLIPISVSEFAKSRFLNKDSRFRKDYQYVFFLLWQKEMRELAAGVYNLMKGTRKHALPVGEFMDRVSTSDEDVEANLSTVF